VAGGPQTDIVIVRDYNEGAFSDSDVIRSPVCNEGFADVAIAADLDLIVTGGWDGK